MRKKPFEVVQKARDLNRLTTLEIIDGVFDQFFEMHGDRNFKDDKAIVGGIAELAGRPVTVIGTQKGHQINENIDRNFGSPHPEGYRKSIRLMKQAEKFGRPIITFINTSGAFCGIEAEDRGIGEAIADSMTTMGQLTVPAIAILTGEGGSGGALALAVANEVWIFENAMYSILSPEGFATILWKDSSRADEAGELMKFTAPELEELNIVDKIIREETILGQKRKEEDVLADLRANLIAKLAEFDTKTPQEIYQERYDRFREF